MPDNDDDAAILDCPQGADLHCGIGFADFMGERGTVEVRVDVGDVLVNGKILNYPFADAARAIALVVLAQRLVEMLGLTETDLAVGCTVRTPSGTPVELRNSTLEERAVWAARVLRSGRGLSLRRAHADLIATTLDALAQRSAQPIRKAAA